VAVDQTLHCPIKICWQRANHASKSPILIQAIDAFKNAGASPVQIFISKMVPKRLWRVLCPVVRDSVDDLVHLDTFCAQAVKTREAAHTEEQTKGTQGGLLDMVVNLNEVAPSPN